MGNKSRTSPPGTILIEHALDLRDPGLVLVIERFIAPYPDDIRLIECMRYKGPHRKHCGRGKLISRLSAQLPSGDIDRELVIGMRGKKPPFTFPEADYGSW